MTFQMKPGMKQLFSAASESMIRAFEAEFGYSLPAEYREFLLSVNGVTIHDSLFAPIRDRWHASHEESPQIYPPFAWPPSGEAFRGLLVRPTDIKGLSAVPLSELEDSGVALCAKDPSYEFSSRLPRHILAIGFTTLNNMVCLGCAGEQYGKVFHWDTYCLTDVSPEEELEGLEFMATSFREFWDNMTWLENEDLVH